MSTAVAPSRKPAVADLLRRQILMGEKHPGAKLNQQEIALELGVSRIPVREAFKTLAGEGLVTIEPYRGAWVRSYREEDVRDIFEIRLALEPMALGLAFNNLTKADLGRAEDMLDAMDYDADVLEASEGNWRFHRALYRPCDRRYLMENIERLHTASQHMTIIGWSVQRRFRASDDEHRALLEACRQRDRSRAVELVEHHTMEAMHSVLAGLAET